MDKLDPACLMHGKKETPKRRSFWCWLLRHRKVVGGYEYAFPSCEQPILMKPVMVCQCEYFETEIPSFIAQMKARQ